MKIQGGNKIRSESNIRWASVNIARQVQLLRCGDRAASKSGSAVSNWSRSVQRCGRIRKRQYNITSDTREIKTLLHVRAGAWQFSTNCSSAVSAQRREETGWMRVGADSHGIPVTQRLRSEFAPTQSFDEKKSHGDIGFTF